MEILNLDRLSKNYGKIQALNQVSFSVPKGSVFGILGPNGSGKTTLLGIIMDILKSSGGSFTLFDEVPTEKTRQRIGTLLETPNFYHYLSAVQNLKIVAAIKQKDESDIERVLEIVNLIQRKDSAFSTYSLGMKQRLAIAAALLGNPEVLVLDEPTNGLDPVGIAEIRALIMKLANEGKTIIMASHMLDEVEKVCTHVAILKYGQLITHGDVNEILVNEDVVEVSSNNLEQLKNILIQFPGNVNVYLKENTVQVNFQPGTANLEEINKYCFERSVVLSHLQLKKKSLESKFLELTN
ncbi:MAG: ATP-binding cassette domain-containing protein [Bacteroidota bacterium]